MVSGSSAVSNSFGSPYNDSCVSQSGWWCPALRLSPIHPHITIHLSPSLAVGVRLCLPLKQFICLPVLLVVSGSPDVSNSFWLVVSGSLHVSNSFVFPYSNSSVSQSGWWCPAFWMSPSHVSPLKAIHLSPSLSGGVRLSGCLQFMCLPLTAIHLSPSLSGGVRLSGCLQFICLPSKQFICLPVWLVVSGSPFVFPYSNPFVCQSGWWCKALRMSPCPFIAIHLSSVWLVVSSSPDVSNSFVSPYYSNSFLSQSGLWRPALRMSPVDLFPLIAKKCLPVWLVVSGSLRVSKSFVRLSARLQVICLPL